MPVSVREISSQKDLKSFIMLPFSLYRDDPLWVPPLIRHERRQFSSSKNPAHRYCDVGLFLAVRDGRAAGRVAAIINRRYTEKVGRKCGRFAWFECEENAETAGLLMDAAESWLESRGMDEIAGPMGFTDNDMTGFLVEGFDELPTIAGSYNPPWYNDIVLSRGYEKEVDYVEYRIKVPETVPEKTQRLAELIGNRSRVRVFSEKSTRSLSRKWVGQIFEVLNDSYKDLYGTTMLDSEEIDYYSKHYLGQVDPEFIKLAVDGDRLVGFIVAMPNLSKAFQRIAGRLLPFGFIHVLREMKRSRVLDFYLAGIRPEYQGKGIDALMGFEIAKSTIDRNMKYAESNHELETNRKIQALWKNYEKRLHRRVRVYRRDLGT